MFGLFDVIIAVVVITVVAVCFGISKLPRIGKLYVLRWGILAALTICINLPVKAVKKLRLPMIWLRHYIWGSGKAMQVPTQIVQDAHDVFITAVCNCLSAEPWDEVPDFRKDDRILGSKYMVYHSTLYEGAGFEGRPTLFYLLGGFTFLFRRDGAVSGKDHYDWHPREDGKYFTSPLGNQWWMHGVIVLLQKVFSSDWFCLPGDENSITGEAGISNRLWDDLHLVGARPFWSWFDQVEILEDGDVDTLLRAANGDYYEEDDCYDEEEEED